jgi:nucleoside permease NupC
MFLNICYEPVTISAFLDNIKKSFLFKKDVAVASCSSAVISKYVCDVLLIAHWMELNTAFLNSVLLSPSSRSDECPSYVPV